jgi:hypothetical protein
MDFQVIFFHQADWGKVTRANTVGFAKKTMQ